MNPDLTKLAGDLASAADPGAVFRTSQLPREVQAAATRKAYHRLARIAHPDAYSATDDKALAQRAFQKLCDWRSQAEEQIAAGTYGALPSAPPYVILKTHKREYQVEPKYVVDDIYNRYACRYRRLGRKCVATLKVVRDPRDNNLACNETRALGYLRRSRLGNVFYPYLPRLLEAFTYQENGLSRQALVMRVEPGWFSLEQVRAAYPAGVDPRDMAWIWRRLLTILGYAHLSGVLHLAVLPANIWIHPELHGLQLRDWTRAAVLRYDPNPPQHRVPPHYKSWYPEAANASLSTRMDNVLAAKSMIYLLGGDTKPDTLPKAVPQPLVAFLRGSTLAGLAGPENAWELKAEFDELLGSLWGEREFPPFSMPTQLKTKEVQNG